MGNNLSQVCVLSSHVHPKARQEMRNGMEIIIMNDLGGCIKISFVYVINVHYYFKMNRISIIVPRMCANRCVFCVSALSLTCGDVQGRFNDLFNRVRTIQKKSGQFDVSQSLTSNVLLKTCITYKNV